MLDKLTYAGNLANLAPVAGHPRYTFVHGDICDPALVRAVLPGHDAVVNFAAESHVDRSIAGAGASSSPPTWPGCRCCSRRAWTPGSGRVVQVSTDEVYGASLAGRGPRTSPLGAELALLRGEGRRRPDRPGLRPHPRDGRPVTRCCNNYGPYQYPEKVIPLFVTNLLDGQPVPLYGDGVNVRDWIHVDDHCRGIQLVLSAAGPGEIYNIDGDAELTNLELTAPARLLRRGWDMVDAGRPTARATTAGTRLDDTALRAMGYAPRRPVRGRPGGDRAWYRGQPRLVGTAQRPEPRPRPVAAADHGHRDPLAGDRRGRHARPGPGRCPGRGAARLHRPGPGRTWT